MILGFVDPWDPLFLDLNIPNYLKQDKEIYWNMLLEYYFTYLNIFNFIILKMLENTAPNNDEDPSKQNLENLGCGTNIYQKT